MDDKIDEGFVKEMDQRNNAALAKVSVKKWLQIVIVSVAINITLFLLFSRLAMGTAEKVGFAFGQFVLGCAIMGFLLGLLIALFPFKGLGYGQRYLRASLIGMFAIECLMVFSHLQNR